MSQAAGAAKSQPPHRRAGTLQTMRFCPAMRGCLNQTELTAAFEGRSEFANS
jgi:hypothetical protein